MRRFAAVESFARAIRYVCTSRAHLRAPVGLGNAMPYGFADAWCPSTEAADHEFLQIKDMGSRFGELTALLAALRACPQADTWGRAGTVA